MSDVVECCGISCGGALAIASAVVSDHCFKFDVSWDLFWISCIVNSIENCSC